MKINGTIETYDLTFGRHILNLEIYEDHKYLHDPDKEYNYLISAKLDNKSVMHIVESVEEFGTSDRDFWGEILIDCGMITEDDYAIDYVIPEFLKGR